jgi:hypothetical protein
MLFFPTDQQRCFCWIVVALGHTHSKEMPDLPSTAAQIAAAPPQRPQDIGRQMNAFYLGQGGGLGARAHAGRVGGDYQRPDAVDDFGNVTPGLFRLRRR